MRDDVAFQSQQFAEGVYNRRDRAYAQQAQAMQQLPGVVQSFWAGQDHAAKQQAQQMSQQMDMAMAQSRLGLDEMRRQQAAEELNWARELHTTDILESQKKVAMAEADYRLAELARKRKELDKEGVAWDPRYLDPIVVAGAKANGLKIRMENGQAMFDLDESLKKEGLSEWERLIEMRANAREYAPRSSAPPWTAVINSMARDVDSLQKALDKAENRRFLLTESATKKERDDVETSIREARDALQKAKTELGSLRKQSLTGSPSGLQPVAEGSPDEDGELTPEYQTQKLAELARALAEGLK